MVSYENVGDSIAYLTCIQQFTESIISNPSPKLGQDAGSNLLSGRFEVGVLKLFSITRDKFRELTGGLRADVNAELQRAIRRSCLKATVFACQFAYEQIDEVMVSWEESEQSLLTQRLNAVNRYLGNIGYKMIPPVLQTHRTKDDLILSKIAEIQTSLQSEIEYTKSRNYILPYNAADFQFNKLVTWDHNQPLSGYFEDLCQQMLNQIIEELLNRFGIVPDLLEYNIRVGWFKDKKYHFWFDEVSREFEGEIRHNQAVSNIYQAKIMTAIKTDIDKILSSTVSSQKRLKKLEGKLNDILNRLKKLTLNQKPVEIITNVNNQFFSDPASEYFEAETVVKERDVQMIRKENISEKVKEVLKICIVGEPGMGKSFLARKIVYDIYRDQVAKKSEERFYDIIWWIDADTTDAKKVESELIQLAKDKGIFGTLQVDKWINKTDDSGDFIGEEEVIRKLFETLKERSWLIVFDNAMDYDQDVSVSTEDLKVIRRKFETYTENYLPSVKNDGHLLLTSRNEYWGRIKHPPRLLRLEEWTDESVKSYLEYVPEGSSYDKIDDVSIEQVTDFQGLPLTVAIAKSYMLDLEGKNKFKRFYIEWSKKLEEVEHDFYDRNLLATVQLSYDRLTDGLKGLINALSCFAPDDIPVHYLFENEPNFIKERLGIDTNNVTSYLERIKKLSLGRYDTSTELYSMHRLVQSCIRKLQDDMLNQSYQICVILLARRFKHSVKEKDSAVTELLSSHIDTIAGVIRNQKPKLISNMNTEEGNEATQLFMNAGQYHFDTGDIESAENQFRTVIEVATEPAQTAKAKKSLANVLFLKGRKYFSDAEKLATEAANYFKTQKNQVDYIDCMNDVVSKIAQRQCLFEKCKLVSLDVKDIVDKYINEKIGEEDIFEHIIQKYVNNEAEKIAEKRGSIYHNLGSLYWTWGRKGDYEEARTYFIKAIEFQGDMVKALEDALDRYSDQEVIDRIVSTIDKKIFFLNVSRMIYGSVLGLLIEFDGEEGQWNQHMKAFKDFKDRAKEKRRYAYTAYYMLAHSWDREVLKKDLPDNFDVDELVDEIKFHDKILAGNDEKYDLIKKIVDLREAVRLSDREVADKISKEAYTQLVKQLEAMKYEFGSDEQKVIRYYDVNTCSVSAILDYANFLYYNKELDKAKQVAEYGIEVTKDIVYPRIAELQILANGSY